MIFEKKNQENASQKNRAEEVSMADMQEIGRRIAALRKAKNLTQAELAEQLSVSYQAVSNWERGVSCPDVALLSPLARALRTDVNALLGFTAKPTDAECAAYVNEVAALALGGDAEAARARIAALLREYPGCPALQYQLAALLMSLPMWGGAGMRPERNGKKPKNCLKKPRRGTIRAMLLRPRTCLQGFALGMMSLHARKRCWMGFRSPHRMHRCSGHSSRKNAAMLKRPSACCKHRSCRPSTKCRPALRGSLPRRLQSRRKRLPSFGCMKRAPRLWGILFP